MTYIPNKAKSSDKKCALHTYVRAHVSQPDFNKEAAQSDVKYSLFYCPQHFLEFFVLFDKNYRSRSNVYYSFLITVRMKYLISNVFI